MQIQTVLIDSPEMFRRGVVEDVEFRSLTAFDDQRGWLVELFREDEIDSCYQPSMAYVSVTLPGIARGPHEHRQQTDLFAFVGPGDCKLYLWDMRPDSSTYGNRQTVIVGESNMQSVIIPPGIVHAYKNISPQPAWVFNAPNCLYRGEGKSGLVDEIRYEDQDSCLFLFD